MKVPELLLLSVSLIMNVKGIIILKFPGSQTQLPLVSLLMNKTLSNKEVTFCVRFITIGGLRNHMLFYDNPNNLQLKLMSTSDYGFVFYGKSPMIFKIPPNTIQPYVWFHFCFTKNDKSYQIVVNGKLWYSSNIMAPPGKYSNIYIGKLDFGDKLFHGQISHLNIWSLAKSKADLLKITQNCFEDYHDNGDILNWSKINKDQLINIKDAVELREGENFDCDFWNDNNKKRKIIPHLIDYNEAKNLCKIMNGKMYIPESKDELVKLYHSDFLKMVCKKIIIPIHRNESGQWVDNSNQPMSSNLRWAKWEPNGGNLQKCVTMEENFEIFDNFCDSTGCPICNWKINPVFLLRGLCSGSDIEHRYVLRLGQKYNEMFVFQGFKKNVIVYDDNKERWVIYEALNVFGGKRNNSFANDTMIGVLNSPTTIPIGLQSWNIKEGICNENIKLKLTSVRPYQ